MLLAGKALNRLRLNSFAGSALIVSKVKWFPLATGHTARMRLAAPGTEKKLLGEYGAIALLCQSVDDPQPVRPETIGLRVFRNGCFKEVELAPKYFVYVRRRAL